MNFISKFINEKVLKITNKESTEVTLNDSNKGNKTNVLLNQEKQIDIAEKKDISDYAKELAGYLQNNVDLDRSLLKMTNDKTNKTNETKKTVIKIKKDNSSKSLKWIFIEFIIWVVLIFFTMSYVQSQPAEKKFLNSSVQLWVNTFQKIVIHFGWVFTKDVDKIYLQKKEKLLDQLVNDEKKVLICLNKETNSEKQKNLQKLYMKIKLFEQQLSNPNYTPLNQFIQQYDQYNLYVYSLNEAVNKECKLKK